MLPAPIPIGVDDFRAVREGGLEYVDKSDLIREIIDRPGVQVMLLPRPRRFGKTLNLSMLRCWFEKQATDLSHLFEGLSIWEAGDGYRAHFQRYPVIHFNFKGSKGASLSHALGVIRKKIGELFDAHRYLLDSERLKKTLDQALEEGLSQLRTAGYDAELRAAGASPVVRFAVAFDGKVVRVRSAGEPLPC